VNGRREGRCVYYPVEPRGLKPLIDWIAHYRAFWTERVDRLGQLRKLSYTWVVGDMDTVVTFTLTPTASGTHVARRRRCTARLRATRSGLSVGIQRYAFASAAL
jgi:uncharacterized protein YndB with AHSA1/START domain